MATAEKKGTVRLLTRTAEPGTKEGRHKRVFGNSQECAHRWAANDQQDGSSGNVHFYGATFYSYGRHFPCARHVVNRKGEKFVLVTTRTYSSTTSGHMHDVRRAVVGQKCFNVDDVDANTRAQHLQNFEMIAERSRKAMATAKRARIHGASHEAIAIGLIREANGYAEAVGLSQRVPLPDDVESWESWEKSIENRKAREQRARTKAQKLKDAEHARQVAADLAEWEQKLCAWRDGGEWPGNCPDYNSPLYRVAFLRVRGSRLETSLRAVVSLKAVLPILEMVRSGVSFSGREGSAEPGAPGFTVDGFELQSVDQERKRVVIGCHAVTFDEIERVAQKAGL